MKKTIVQFIKFGIVGGMNTILSYLIYLGLVSLGIHYLIADSIAFVITVFISYLLNGCFVFGCKGKRKFDFFELIRVYASYSFSSLFLSLFLLWIEVELLGIPKQIAPMISLFFTIPVNFILNKFWAYRKREEKNGNKN